MAGVGTWNFFNKNVQGGLLEGRYMNAAYTLLASGPPRLGVIGSVGSDLAVGDAFADDVAFPLGIMQSFSMGSSAQWARIWELGSERSYFIRGRVQGQLQIGGVMYHGPSLLRRLYAYLDAGQYGEALYNNNAQTKTNASANGKGRRGFKIPPGYNNLWLELASDVFSQPVGLLLYMKDSNEDTVGAFYFEYCNVANTGLQMDANGLIISENASIMYERIVPVQINSIAVIKNSASAQEIVGSPVVGSAAD